MFSLRNFCGSFSRAPGTLSISPLSFTQVRWATKAAAGSSKNGRKSAGKRLGLKKGNLQYVKVGQIIARQRGTKWLPGEGVFLGRDHTMHAAVPGRVVFTRAAPKLGKNGKQLYARSVINVLPYPKTMEESIIW